MIPFSPPVQVNDALTGLPATIPASAVRDSSSPVCDEVCSWCGDLASARACVCVVLCAQSRKGPLGSPNRARSHFSLSVVPKPGPLSLELFDFPQVYHLFAFFATQVSRRGSVIPADSETVW